MQRKEPHITRLMQLGLRSAGYALPLHGADGQWGTETQGAYNRYVADQSDADETVINAVVDLSHHNPSVDFSAAWQSGILGVLHKATQGTRFIDPEYRDRHQEAASHALLWGAYHFGVGGDGSEQAEFFVETVQPNGDVLMVLDLEDNPTGASMSIASAEAFVTRIRDLTGRWPGLYSGHYIKDKLGQRVDTPLANCWFWLAQYGHTAYVPKAWATWTMWQYTDGALGPEPHVVPGIGRCDRNKFHGSADALKSFWSAP